MEPEQKEVKVFNLLKRLANSKNEEGTFNEGNIMEMLNHYDEEDDDEDELDIILEENIIEEKIRSLSVGKFKSNEEINDIMGLPQQRQKTDYDTQLRLVQAAIQQNRKLKEILQSFECELLLIKRDLNEKEKQHTHHNLYSIERFHNMDFYVAFCAPYFKSSGFPCPVNPDQLLKEKVKQALYENIDIISNWEEDEVDKLETAIRDSFVQDYFNSLDTNVDLKEEQDTEQKLKVVNEVSYIRNSDLVDVITKYNEDSIDWDQISTTFQNPHSGRDCKLIWDMYLKPSIRKGRWTKREEKALLEKAKELEYQDWDRIAREIDFNRTGYQCFSHYQQHLMKESRKWSNEQYEDFQKVLRFAKIGPSINWSRVKYFFDSTDFSAIYNRWYKTRCRSNEEPRKGKFNKKEDELILYAVQKGIPVNDLHRVLHTRNAVQIRERYINHLGEHKRTFGSWTPEEDALLLRLVDTYGEGQWAKMSTHFKSRSRTQIRQHYDHIKKSKLKNPNFDVQTMKKQKFSKNGKRKMYMKKLKRDVERKKDLDIFTSDIDFLMDPEDVELAKHFIFKKQFLHQTQSIKNAFILKAYEIQRVSGLLGANLIYSGENSVSIDKYKRNLHDYIFGALQYGKATEGILSDNFKIGDTVKLFPPNIATVSTLRNIMSRMKLEKGLSKNEEEWNLEDYVRGPAFNHAFDLWFKRMFMLFSTSYMLSNLDFNNIVKKVEKKPKSNGMDD